MSYVLNGSPQCVFCKYRLHFLSAERYSWWQPNSLESPVGCYSLDNQLYCFNRRVDPISSKAETPQGCHFLRACCQQGCPPRRHEHDSIRLTATFGLKMPHRLSTADMNKPCRIVEYDFDCVRCHWRRYHFCFLPANLESGFQPGMADETHHLKCNEQKNEGVSELKFVFELSHQMEIHWPPVLSVSIWAINQSCWWNVETGGDLRINGPLCNAKSRSEHIWRPQRSFVLLFQQATRVLVDFKEASRVVCTQYRRKHCWNASGVTGLQVTCDKRQGRALYCSNLHCNDPKNDRRNAGVVVLKQVVLSADEEDNKAKLLTLRSVGGGTNALAFRWVVSVIGGPETFVWSMIQEQQLGYVRVFIYLFFLFLFFFETGWLEKLLTSKPYQNWYPKTHKEGDKDQDKLSFVERVKTHLNGSETTRSGTNQHMYAQTEKLNLCWCPQKFTSREMDVVQRSFTFVCVEPWTSTLPQWNQNFKSHSRIREGVFPLWTHNCAVVSFVAI